MKHCECGNQTRLRPDKHKKSKRVKCAGVTCDYTHVYPSGPARDGKCTSCIAFEEAGGTFGEHRYHTQRG